MATISAASFEFASTSFASFASPGVWLPWLFASVLIIMIASLMGQAAYIRSRLDSISPPSFDSNDVTCSACDPAIRAYSLNVNVANTMTLSTTPPPTTVKVNATGQLARCASTLKYVNDGTFDAKWLVLRRNAGSDKLVSDVANGKTRYIVFLAGTYVIVSTLGSTAANNVKTLVAADDVLFLVQTVQTAASTFTSTSASATAAGTCVPLIVQAPVTPLATGDPLFAAIAGATATLSVQGWGYAGSTSSSRDIMTPVG